MERINKVYYKDDKPMIRLSNNFLKECGFWVGDTILVTYDKNKITIVKKEVADLKNKPMEKK